MFQQNINNNVDDDVEFYDDKVSYFLSKFVTPIRTPMVRMTHGYSTNDVQKHSIINKISFPSVDADILSDLSINGYVCSGKGRYNISHFREKRNGIFLNVEMRDWEKIATYVDNVVVTSLPVGKYELLRYYSYYEDIGPLYDHDMSYVYTFKKMSHASCAVKLWSGTSYRDVVTDNVMYVVPLDGEVDLKIATLGNIRVQVERYVPYKSAVTLLEDVRDTWEGIFVLIDGKEFKWKNVVTVDVAVHNVVGRVLDTKFGHFNVSFPVQEDDIVEVRLLDGAVLRRRVDKTSPDTDRSVLQHVSFMEWRKDNIVLPIKVPVAEVDRQLLLMNGYVQKYDEWIEPRYLSIVHKTDCVLCGKNFKAYGHLCLPVFTCDECSSGRYYPYNLKGKSGWVLMDEPLNFVLRYWNGSYYTRGNSVMTTHERDGLDAVMINATEDVGFYYVDTKVPDSDMIDVKTVTNMSSALRRFLMFLKTYNNNTIRERFKVPRYY